MIKTDFALVNDELMRKFNKQHLGLDESTDVLAFSMNEELPDGVYFLGEIVVNRDAAKRQAKQYKVSEKEELARLITHGALHLLGFEDKTPANKKKMKLAEDRIVKCLKNL